MSDANVVKLLQPGSFADPLTEVLRNGARALLAQAIEAEVSDFLAKHVNLKTTTGLRRVVRRGHLPEREAMTGIGPIAMPSAKGMIPPMTMPITGSSSTHYTTLYGKGWRRLDPKIAGRCPQGITSRCAAR